MINTVKIQGNGYLVDGCMSVPKDTGNRDYQEVLEWIASGNEVLPEYTDEELEAKSVQTKLAEAHAYLASTGWYIERLNDPSSGKAVPDDVLTARANARATINELEVV
jgi:hypothetical protein